MDTTAEFLPLRCCQKLDGVGDIRVREYLRDQQEHLQSNIVEEKVGETTIGDEEPTRWPGNVCSIETTGCSTVHIEGGLVNKECLRCSFITSTLPVDIKTMWEV
jgi:hypothetical protein